MINITNIRQNIAHTKNNSQTILNRSIVNKELGDKNNISWDLTNTKTLAKYIQYKQY